MNLCLSGTTWTVRPWGRVMSSCSAKVLIDRLIRVVRTMLITLILRRLILSRNGLRISNSLILRSAIFCLVVGRLLDVFLL